MAIILSLALVEPTLNHRVMERSTTILMVLLRREVTETVVDTVVVEMMDIIHVHNVPTVQPQPQHLRLLPIVMPIEVATVLGIGQTLVAQTVVVVVRRRHLHQEVAVVRHRVEARREEAVAQVRVGQEVQDNINKTLTQKIPLNSYLRGFFRLKYRGRLNFKCHICRTVIRQNNPLSF